MKTRIEGEGIAERELWGEPDTYATFRDKVLVIRQNASCLTLEHEPVETPKAIWRPLDDHVYGVPLEDIVEDMSHDVLLDVAQDGEKALASVKRTVALAKKIVSRCDQLLDAIDAGDIEQVSWAAFEVGEMWELLVIKCGWEDHALRGKKIDAAVKAGGETLAAPARERAAQYQAEIDRLHTERPRATHSQLSDIVAKKHGVAKRTIQRRTRLKKD